MKNSSYWINLISFCARVTDLVDPSEVKVLYKFSQRGYSSTLNHIPVNILEIVSLFTDMQKDGNNFGQCSMFQINHARMIN